MRTEDGYIIQHCLDGDSASFGFLVEKYKKAVYALAYSRIGNFHDAEDITQEVFINAYRKLRDLRRWDNFMGWLHRITINQCKMLIRARSKRPESEFTEDQEPGIMDQPSLNSYRENMMYESIRESLNSLPDIYRQVMTLRYFGGMTVKEMARFLGVSSNTVDRRIRGALTQLREEIPAMMNKAYEQNQLPASFTFRMIEMVKRIKIHTMPRMAGLPWGLSLAAGIIITTLSLNPNMSITSDTIIPTGLPLPAETKVLKAGEMPVDILKTSEISAISSKQGNGNGGKPILQEPQNAFMLAPYAKSMWVQKGDMPNPRIQAGSCVGDDRGIYVIGGRNVDDTLPDTESYNALTETWNSYKDMPTTRVAPNVEIVGGKIYAIGGVQGDKILSVIEKFDPINNKWSKLKDGPLPRYLAGSAVVDGKIYIMGGSPVFWQFTSAVERYDPKTDTWESLSPLPQQLASPGLAVLDDEVYCIGGRNTAFMEVSLVLKYNPPTDTWEQMPNTTWRVIA